MAAAQADDHDHEHDHDHDHDHEDEHTSPTTAEAEEAHAHAHPGEGSCDGNFAGDYNKPLHIAAIFIVMAFSFFGTLLPVLFRRLSNSKKLTTPFQAIKLFGAGVILCTAFVHMFVPAQQILGSECLPEVFHEYHAWAGLIALLGVLFTHFFQVLAGTHVKDRLAAKSKQDEVNVNNTAKQLPTDAETAIPADHDHHAGHAHGAAAADAERRISAYALEAGVAIHSIIIGITLGAARGEFKPLLIALTFHQFFEGIALSSIILSSPLTSSRIHSLLLILFYSLTTPVGIAIGVGVNETYNANAVTALIVTGVLEAISAGILVYDGLVNVVCPHFGGRAFLGARWGGRAIQFVALWLGALAMAVVGRWA
ncbi:high-affinity Zn(2+) transporter zrt1 [Rhizophlyctis rosea]|uniref:High-affinity Zn(2+) transporter zrt1 n=1 Tax=Rhizophlyctis rosea TaxID=64517 RepID=A0AAD5X220_9FUNG|nr:high-affinity Zn(2+) transporter zrt1 [Rhizophlyctis rosea]